MYIFFSNIILLIFNCKTCYFMFLFFIKALSNGVDFFIDENTSYLSDTASPIYMRRAGLFQNTGSVAAWIPTTGTSYFYYRYYCCCCCYCCYFCFC